MNVELLVLAVVVGLVLVGVIVYLNRQQREEFKSAIEHVESNGGTGTRDGNGDSDDGHTKGGTKIPIGARAKAVSTTAKIFFGSVLMLFVIVGIFVFQTIRTGSPGEMLFADQLLTVGKVLVGVAVGITGTNIARRHEGDLINIYETDDGETRPEKIPIDTRNVESGSEGHDVVTEYSQSRVLGLFRRYKHVAEDAELEGTNRAPGKPIKHRIADHAVEVEPGLYVQRTQEQNDTSDPNVRADYVYSAPVELSYEDYINMRQSKKRKEQRLRGMKTTLAVVEDEFQKLLLKLRSGKYKEESEVMDRLERLMDMVSSETQQQPQSTPRQTHVDVQNGGQSGQAQTQSQPQPQAQTDGGSNR